MQQNKWTIISVIAAVAVGLLLGVWVQGDSHSAEAKIGGMGNLVVGGTPTSNHPHNFAYSSSGAHTSDSSEERVCVFCHTPHSADATAALLNAPLWNHTLSTGVVYSIKTPGFYTRTGVSGNVALLVTPLSTPDGASRLCLSCHDGTVSVGDVRSEFAAGGIPMAASTCIDISTSPPGHMYSNSGTCTAYIGSNLTKMHVVSIPMNSGLISAHDAQCGTVTGQTTKLSYPFDTSTNSNALPDTVFLRPTTATYSGSSGINGSSIRGDSDCGAACDKNYGDGYNYGVQCSTCHDPHYWADTNDSSKEGYRMLVAPLSNLCNSCHYVPSSCP